MWLLSVCDVFCERAKSREASNLRTKISKSFETKKWSLHYYVSTIAFRMSNYYSLPYLLYLLLKLFLQTTNHLLFSSSKSEVI